MSNNLELRALLRSFTARLASLSCEEARLLDVAWQAIEQVRAGGDRQWQRRIATGPGDVDTSWHLERAGTRKVVKTACRGSWPTSDGVDMHPNPPLHERCDVCWSTVVGGSAIGMALLEVARQLAIQDAEREAQHERDRAEVVGRVPDGTPGVRDQDAPCTDFSPGAPNGYCHGDGHHLCGECKYRVPVREVWHEAPDSEFDAGHLTKVGGAEPYEVEIERGEGGAV